MSLAICTTTAQFCSWDADPELSGFVSSASVIRWVAFTGRSYDVWNSLHFWASPSKQRNFSARGRHKYHPAAQIFSSTLSSTPTRYAVPYPLCRFSLGWPATLYLSMGSQCHLIYTWFDYVWATYQINELLISHILQGNSKYWSMFSSLQTIRTTNLMIHRIFAERGCRRSIRLMI